MLILACIGIAALLVAYFVGIVALDALRAPMWYKVFWPAIVPFDMIYHWFRR